MGRPMRHVLRTHLWSFERVYADPELLPSLYALQHDEKDLFRAVGPKGLQDWGDGECQRLERELSAALAATSTMISSLRELPASLALTPSLYTSVKAVMHSHSAQLGGYRKDAVTLLAKLSATCATQTKRRSKLPAREAKEHERLGKSIAFLNNRTAEISLCDRRVSALLASLLASPLADDELIGAALPIKEPPSALHAVDVKSMLVAASNGIDPSACLRRLERPCAGAICGRLRSMPQVCLPLFVVHRGHVFGFSTTRSCAPEPQHDDKSEVLRATPQQGGESKPIEKDVASCSDIVGGVSESWSPCKPTFAIETEAERATFGVNIAMSNAVVVG